MKLNYYRETDSLYIELSEAPGVQTREVAEGINVDLAADGSVVGIDIDGALHVLADTHAVDRVLSNLVTNAAKFSPPGSAVRIDARVDEARSAAVVGVTDEGPGIPREQQERVFDRFYQLDGERGPRNGTGIGLSIVRRYVELLGGSVWVESTPERGAAFRFTLPLADAAP